MYGRPTDAPQPEAGVTVPPGLGYLRRELVKGDYEALQVFKRESRSVSG